jgi:hypothetical protein
MNTENAHRLQRSTRQELRSVVRSQRMPSVRSLLPSDDTPSCSAQRPHGSHMWLRTSHGRSHGATGRTVRFSEPMLPATPEIPVPRRRGCRNSASRRSTTSSRRARSATILRRSSLAGVGTPSCPRAPSSDERALAVSDDDHTSVTEPPKRPLDRLGKPVIALEMGYQCAAGPHDVIGSLPKRLPGHCRPASMCAMVVRSVTTPPPT